MTHYLKKEGNPSYAKNMDDLFQILTKIGDPKKAIQWADKRLKEMSNKKPAETGPGTTVQNLVKELAKYFPDDTKNKYI